MHPLLQSYLEEMPLIAILRGITSAEATDVVGVLYQAGFRIVEVPLNSPDPIRSIEQIASTFGDRMLVGAGTVLDPAEVEAVCDAGGHLYWHLPFASHTTLLSCVLVPQRNDLDRWSDLKPWQG